MIKVQNQFDRIQNTIVHIFYRFLQIALSAGLGFLSSQCILFEGVSPFSLILLSCSPNIGMIPTFCYLGATFGTLFNPFDLSTFKYITALTMVYVIYMIFQRSLRVIKRDTAVLTAACCFTSGFLFLLVGNLDLFNVLVLIGESVLICCCIFFINYANKAFRKCCYLSTQEIISVAVTLILILIALGNLYVFNLSIARIIGLSILFLSIYCLKTSHTVVLGTLLGIILATVTSGGEAIFASVVVGTLAGCIFSSFSDRFSIISFIIVYYVLLFFFGKFPWNFWYFSEPLISYVIIFFIPKNKLRLYLSSYLAVKNVQKEKSSKNTEKLLKECSKRCKSICPKAEICYSKNEPEIIDLLSKTQEQYEETGKTGNIENSMNFCIKKSAMAKIIQSQISVEEVSNLDNLIEQLDKVTKKIDQYIKNNKKTPIFHEDKEKAIKNTLQAQNISVKEISFITDEFGCDRCNILFYVSKDVLYKKIVKEAVSIYFPSGAQIQFSKKGGDIFANIKEQTTYSIECAAICKTKEGEYVCGDQAVGFSAGKGKYYLLLADGMGSGKEAFIQSELMIKTIKKLIKGGSSVLSAFDTYRSVIRINDPFGFSTIDACAIDLNTGCTELYKAGAFDSFLLSNDRCYLFPGGGIPIGLADIDRIKHETIRLHHGDYLILASDGLFLENNELEKLLIDCKNDDVNLFARKILSAQSKMIACGDDDVTVMVCKFIKSQE